MSLSAFAASDKDNKGKGKGADKSIATESSNKDLLKQFKQEMNDSKKALKNLQDEKDALQAEYDALAATVVDEEDADAVAAKQAALDALQAQIDAIDAQLADPKAAMKKIINERYMVIKSVKSGFNVMDYDSAEALVAAMYAAASDKEAWSITVKNNLIKLEGPAYLKGGKIMFPLKALENLGATVTWSETDKTVTVTKDGVTVVFSPTGTTATQGQTVSDAAVTLDTDTDTGIVTGTVTGSIIDPATGDVIGDIDFTVTGTSDDFVVDPVTGEVTGTLAEPITVTGDITDPETGEVIGTVTGEISGSLTDPTFTLSGSTGLDTQGLTVLNCGRAYVPLKDLVEIFGLDVTADTTTDTIDVDDPDSSDDAEE